MIEEYDLSFLNLNKIEDLLRKKPSDVHGLLSDGKSSFNYGPPILIYPEFEEIYKILKKCVIIYCSKHNVPKQKFINSWFNITNSGSKLKAHNHGEDGLSGAFYVSVGKQSVPLIFPHISIKPYPGLLIIFPSNLVHHTKSEKEQRIVISFNTDDEESTRYTGH